MKTLLRIQETLIMKTLKGVIAGSVYADYQTPIADSNLCIYPWYFILSSEIYELPPPEPVVYDLSVDPEPMGIAAHLVSGVFRSARQELEIEPERMGITATFIEGRFSTPRIELSVEPESISVEATFVEGSLVQSPVYRAPALSVSISMNIIGGSHE